MLLHHCLLCCVSVATHTSCGLRYRYITIDVADKRPGCAAAWAAEKQSMLRNLTATTLAHAIDVTGGDWWPAHAAVVFEVSPAARNPSAHSPRVMYRGASTRYVVVRNLVILAC